MNLYQVDSLERLIDGLTQDNAGEIPDYLLKALIEAEASTPVKLEEMAKFLQNLENFCNMAKMEEKRIKEKREKVENRIDKIKEFLTPFISRHGSFNVGIFKISVRKSERVELDDNFEYICDKKYIKTQVNHTIDKDQIKKDIKLGQAVPGARIEQHDNLQIK